MQAGDTLTGKVHLYAPEGTGISSRSYYESRGMPLLCWLYEYEDVTVEEGEGEVSLIVRIKNQISDSLHTVLPDIPAKICAAIALGEKESLPQAVETDFRRARGIRFAGGFRYASFHCGAVSVTPFAPNEPMGALFVLRGRYFPVCLFDRVWFFRAAQCNYAAFIYRRTSLHAQK